MVHQAQKCRAEKGFSVKRKRATRSLRCPVDTMGSRAQTRSGRLSLRPRLGQVLAACQETCQMNSSELEAKVKSKLLELCVCCRFKPGYSRVSNYAFLDSIFIPEIQTRSGRPRRRLGQVLAACQETCHMNSVKLYSCILLLLCSY